MMLAAFWALAPSAVSFETLGDAITLGRDALPIVGGCIAAIFSIALGTLIGWSVFNPVSSSRTTAPEEVAFAGGSSSYLPFP